MFNRPCLAVSLKMDDILICLVDDDEDDRFLIREAVETVIELVKVQEFCDGKDFLNQIEQLISSMKTVVVLMDINMPRVNGIEVVKILKSDLKYKHLPVFFVSTASNQQLISQAMATGASGYFIKPTSIQGLQNLALHIKNYLISQ